MAISLGSNIASLTAQRRLAQNSSRLGTVFERLSSGQRINKASDDAAGLAVADSLRAGARVYRQATRNVNDGISLLSVAEGALRELNSILMRQMELAEQSANGPYSLTQRRTMQQESEALVEEYNRILDSTEFAGVKPFAGTPAQVDIQAGYGSRDVISLDLGEELSRAVGTGAYENALLYSCAGARNDVTLGDINLDGILDMVLGPQTTVASAMLGNGNGTFKKEITFVTGETRAGRYTNVFINDYDNDGLPDLAISAMDSGKLFIHFGNGNGTFEAGASYGIQLPASDMASADFNGDGLQDMLMTYGPSNTTGVFLGNADGTFCAERTFATYMPYNVTTADFNADGIADMAVNDSVSRFYVRLGNGDGTFKSAATMPNGTPGGSDIVAVDLNLDGLPDIVSSDYNATSGTTVSTALNLGNGSFASVRSFTAIQAPYVLASGDLNNDGYNDIVVSGTSSGKHGALLGDGKGGLSLASVQSYGAAYGVDLGDLNGDGVLDVVNAYDDVYITMASTAQSPRMPHLNLLSQADTRSALDFLDNQSQRVNRELASVGALQSRLQIAAGNLSSLCENYTVAESRIRDADIAQEAADLLRYQILQQAGAAVLSQANQQPEMALRLLS